MLTDIFLYAIIKTVQENSTFKTVSKPLTICTRQKGIIMMTVRNMVSPRTGKEVANQFIINDGNKLVFQSYESMIVEYDKMNNSITFGKDWNYSNTTSKYRNEFLNMYFPELADTKKLKTIAQVAKAQTDNTIEMQLGAFIYKIKFEQ